MKWGLLVIFTTMNLWAVTPIMNDYNSQESVFGEMRNITDNAQDQSFTIVTTTPNVTDMREGQIFIYASTQPAKDVSLMLRIGTTVYSSPTFPVIKVK